VEILFTLAFVIPFFLILGLFVAKRLLYVCGPNEVLVFSGIADGSGRVRRGYKTVKGGFRVRIPLIQLVDSMDLTNMTVEVSVNNAYSKGGIPLSVQGVANLKVAGEQPVLDRALERFLGNTRKEIITVAKETLEGNLRGVLSQLTPEEVNNDKIAFAEKLLEEGEADLSKLGLSLDTLKIQNVSDEVGYLDSIGRRQTASLIQRAREAEAEARSQAAIRDAENRRRARMAELQAEIEIATAQTEKRIKDAQTRREALIAEEVGKVKAAIAKSEAELKVQQARVEQVRRKLAADVLAPAKAGMEASQNNAKGKAAKITEDGKATAAVLTEMIRTWQTGGDAARDIFLMQKLQTVMDSLVSTIQTVQVDKITVLPAGGTGRAAQAATLNEELKAALGVDLAAIAKRLGGADTPPPMWIADSTEEKKR